MCVMQSIHRYTWAGVLGALAKQGRAKEALEVRLLVLDPNVYPSPKSIRITHMRVFF